MSYIPGLSVAQLASGTPLATDGVVYTPADGSAEKRTTVTALLAAAEITINSLDVGPTPATLSDITLAVFSASANKAVQYPLSVVALASIVPVVTTGSGSSRALAFPASGNTAYDITLTANCTFTLSGGTSGQLQLVTLVIRGGAGGFTATLPSGIKWPGGVAPTVDGTAGSYNEFYIRTLDGGVTYSGNY